MSVKALTVGQMQENCYLLWDEHRNTIIIDPGDDAEYIIQTILDNELIPRTILATHGHVDHTMAALELKLAFQIPFYMSIKDEFLLSRMTETAKHFLNFDPGPPPEVDVYLKNKSEIKVGEISLDVISTPGHTPGSVCFFEREENIVFVGDLMFADGSFGEQNRKYSDPIEHSKSVAVIEKLPKNTIVYPGHGESFVLP
jgi:glyoxylase-like metal-dependent hydrolase (beta-lactamase superfamily II)